MVSISPILKTIPYVRGKTDDEINVAVAAAGVPDPEKVKIVTGFIDNLINLEVGKQTVAKDTTNSEAPSAAKGNLDKYNQEKDSAVTLLVREVADTLTKDFFIVQQLVGRDCQGYQDFNKTSAEGLNNIEQSTEVLLNSAIDMVNHKLSDYSMKIDTNNLQQSAKALVEELRNPPKPKSQTTINREADSLTETATKTGTSTTGTPPAAGTVNTTTETTKSSETSADSEKAPTADDVENFVKSIQQASPALANLSKSRKGLEVLSQRISSISEEAGGTVNQATLDQFQNNIFPNLADEKKFTDAVSKLSQVEKTTLKKILCAVHGQADKDITCNEMSVHARNINKGLGANSTSLQNINEGIDNLVKTRESDTQPNKQPDLANLKKVNQLLVTFEEELKKAGELSSAAEKVTAREEAQKKLLNELKKSLDANLIDVADLKMLKEVLAKPDSANSNYNERANKFLKDLNISTDDLKQWGSMTAMLAVGLMIFCPRAIGNLVKTGTGLATTAAKTLEAYKAIASGLKKLNLGSSLKLN